MKGGRTENLVLGDLRKVNRRMPNLDREMKKKLERLGGETSASTQSPVKDMTSGRKQKKRIHLWERGLWGGWGGGGGGGWGFWGWGV